MKDRVDMDEALARLGAPLLRRDGEALPAGCPDAGIIAGYLDRTLDNAERARCEEHFAGCARCQAVLADLVRLEPPAPVVRPREAPAGLWSLRFRWEWLAPAAAVLAVGVVWTVVRPLVWKTAPPVESTLVLSKAPAATGEAGSEEARAALKGTGEPTRTEKEKAALDNLVQPGRMQAESKEALGKASAPGAKREIQAPAEPTIAQNLPVEPQKDIRPEAVPVQKVSGAAKPAPPPPPAPAAAPAERTAVFEARAGAPSARAAQVVATADAAHQPWVMVSSPSKAVSWRIGASGSIEQSVDGGRTWEKQSAGTVANLAAASAPSDAVCWIVGQRGTVLRTTDGRTWEVLGPPAAVDLVSVSARDSLAASVVASDGRRFSTVDGGRTWQAP